MAKRRRSGEPLAPPLVPASTFFLPGDPAGQVYRYGREGNPTWSALEEEYAALGRAPCLAFASGMAACAAIVDGLVPRGGRVVAPADGYYAFRSLLQARGVEVESVPSGDSRAFARAARGATLVWVETPSNPGLDVADLAATAEACRAAGALLVVDNTLATAVGQDPFAFGADVVVVSATKATSGHSDALIGLASARDAAVLAKLKTARTLGGGIPGVMEAWLCARGLKTLALRLARSSSSALALAQALSGRMPVTYPGLPSHPQHTLAARQMTHFGPVLTFDLGSKDRAERFCAGLQWIAEATSFGGAETTLERRARWGGDDVSPGLIRLSVGLEAPEAILDDLNTALGR
ncbi:MAG TPA: aminotransferase class I/II-fold pyridoxal phosphate-dependent enzyme [Polyangiaceae bacterium]|jgi:cystathionine gamma-lyase